jgi:D-sedoheptulose 7-phosphate isomerase
MSASRKVIEEIAEALKDAFRIKMRLYLENVKTLGEIAYILIKALRTGKRVYLFGNGGSAADAQHIACEMQGKFFMKRSPLPVMALTTNTSTLTAIGNDFGFEEVFSRQINSLVRRGDVVIAISTSGNSPNILRAVRTARRLGAIVIGLTGRSGGKLKRMTKLCICVPSDNVARIQESHITIGHILCQVIESVLFS